MWDDAARSQAPEGERGEPYRRCGQGGPSAGACSNWPDGLAVIIGGAGGLRGPRSARTPGGPCSGGTRTNWRKNRYGRRKARRRDVLVGGAAVLRALFADIEGFLNGRKRDFGGIFDLLGSVRHVQSQPLSLFTRRRACECPPASSKPVPTSGAQAPLGGLSATSANILLAERCE